MRVVVGGEIVAASEDARFLFETGMPVRYYLAAEDIDMARLTPSDKRTSCPYKGDAHYWSVTAGGEIHQDIVWGYPEPIPECPKIKGLFCFFNEVVDDIFVDGEPVPKIKTRWSRD